MVIENNRFWRLVKASKKPSAIIPKVNITATGVETPNECLLNLISLPTKEFVRGAKKRHNDGINKLYKRILEGGDESTRYNLQLQASLYREKLTEEDKTVFDEETEWRNATDDKVFAWIRSLFENVK